MTKLQKNVKPPVRPIRHDINSSVTFGPRPILSVADGPFSENKPKTVDINGVPCLKLWLYVPAMHNGEPVAEIYPDGTKVLRSAEKPFVMYCTEADLADGYEKHGENYVLDTSKWLVSCEAGVISLQAKVVVQQPEPVEETEPVIGG